MSERISELGEMCAPDCAYIREEPAGAPATAPKADHTKLAAAVSVLVVVVLFFIVRMDDIWEALK